MRPGGRRADWTCQEVRWLLDNAGRVPVRELCRHLRRSRSSVEHMAAELRRQGHGVSLRCHEPRTATCPACGRPSATVLDPRNRTGVCRPCQLRRRLTAIAWSTDELLSRLPAAERAAYGESEGDLAPRADDPAPMPPRVPPTAGYAERMRALESYDVALERWESRRLERAVNAARRRRERIAAKARRGRS